MTFLIQSGLLYKTSGGGGGAETGYFDYRTSSNFSDTHAFTGSELPAEKIAVVLVTGRGVSTVSSCTIAGTTTTLRQQSTNGTNSVEILESDTALSAGNSGTIDVVFNTTSGTVNQVSIIIVGIGSRTYVDGNSVNNDDGGSYDVGFDTTAGELILYGATATSGTQTWSHTGTHDVDGEIITDSQRCTGGTFTASGGTPETFAATTNAFQDGVAAAASFS